MSGREGGKLKPLKQPKKEKKELDEVSAKTIIKELFRRVLKFIFSFAGGYGAAKEEQRAAEKVGRSSQNSRAKRTSK